MTLIERTYRITVCAVCGLEAPFECEHMRAAGTTGENVYRSIEVVPVDQLAGAAKAERQRIVERLLHAANLVDPDELSRTRITLERMAIVLITEGRQ